MEPPAGTFRECPDLTFAGSPAGTAYFIRAQPSGGADRGNRVRRPPWSARGKFGPGSTPLTEPVRDSSKGGREAIEARPAARQINPVGRPRRQGA